MRHYRIMFNNTTGMFKIQFCDLRPRRANEWNDVTVMLDKIYQAPLLLKDKVEAINLISKMEQNDREIEALSHGTWKEVK